MVPVSCRFDDIVGLDLPPVSEHINTNTVCGNADLSKKQYEMCKVSPEAVASAIQGLQIAVHECKRQFKNNRWDCTSLETRNKIPLTSRFFHTGFREAAFFHAVSSAAVSYSVARACSLGKISECECASKEHAVEAANQIHRQIIRNGGDESGIDDKLLKYAQSSCDHDINFAIKFSRKFLGERQSSKDFYTHIMLHNYRVGRLSVSNNMRPKCKCHGTSGSCSMKTCWQVTPTMQMVGAKLKMLYANAAKLSHDNRVQRNTVRGGNRVPRLNRRGRSRELIRGYGISIERLVYWNDSPEYCVSNPSIDVFGTKGRFCSPAGNSMKIGSCSDLCCHRGHRTYRKERIEQCHCRFHWCCRVECDACPIVEEISVCR